MLYEQVQNSVMRAVNPTNPPPRAHLLRSVTITLSTYLLVMLLTSCAKAKEPNPPEAPPQEPEIILVKPNRTLPPVAVSHPKTFPTSQRPSISSPVAIVINPVNRHVLFENTAMNVIGPS